MTGQDGHGNHALLLRCLVLFAVSRLVTLLAAGLVGLAHPGVGLVQVLTGTWDAHLYLAVIREGYPHGGPHGDPRQIVPTAAFFPLYPLLIEGFSQLTGASVALAGVFVALAFGAAATVLVAFIARDIGGPTAAVRTAALFCFAPGAVVFSLTYSEGVMITCCAASLLFLMRRRWLAAGVMAALATASRPNAIVVVACCCWCAGVAIARRREWAALVAPLLSPLGVLAYFAFLWKRTGQATYWFTVERVVWHDQVDFGVRNYHDLTHFLGEPLKSPYLFSVGASFVAAVILIVVLSKSHLPAEFNIFAIGIVVIASVSHVVFPNPRFLLTAFPFSIALGIKARETVYFGLLASFAALMALLFVFYAVGSVDLFSHPPLFWVAP